jgi:copper(I)-binding protein
MQLNRRWVVKSALVAAGAAILAVPARAQDFWVSQLRISKPWAAPTQPGAKSAEVYMLIENRSGDLDRLVQVTTPVAERASFVEGGASGDVLQSVAYIDLRARREIALRPGRIYVLLDGLKQPLVKGRPFPMTLAFQSGQRVDVRVDVDNR